MPYIGNPNVQTTTQQNTELVVTPQNWVNVKMAYKQFFFYPETDCTVKINGSDPIFLRAYQDWKIIIDDKNHLEPITSFIIVEANVDYSFVAGY